MQNADRILSEPLFSILEEKLVKTNLAVFVRVDHFNDHAVLLSIYLHILILHV